MSKIIKPLLNEDGTQVKRPIEVGEYYYSLLYDDYAQCETEREGIVYLIYCEEKWKPKEHEMYYFFDLYYCEINIRNYCNLPVDNMNIEIGNYFRTKEEAEQADIQVILDNLKEYYKNKNKEGN